MDFSSLNYRQLQTEAKKYGIKANQKIEILRVQLKEKFENSNVEATTHQADFGFKNVHDHEFDFMEHIKDNKSSTPIAHSTNNNKINDSSTDLDKIFQKNERISQFFDDVIQFPLSKERNSDSNVVEISTDLKIKELQSLNLIPINENHKPKDSIKVKKHKLNETFEMDAEDLQNSQITMEQRLNVASNKKNKEDFKLPIKTINFITKPKVTKEYLSNNAFKTGLPVISNLNLKRKSQTNVSYTKKYCSTDIPKVTSIISKNNETERKSIFNYKPKSPSRTVSRPSYVVSKIKNDNKPNVVLKIKNDNKSNVVSNRKTFVASPLQKPTWKK